MPRRPRLAAGGIAYHVLNRRSGRLPLFKNQKDYRTFEEILLEAHQQFSLRITAYCLMPNHWHLLLWPRHDGELSEAVRWITVTHTQRWHAHHHTSGMGSVYQGRFKSFPVQRDEHFLTVARYIERNPLRANLVERAENWQWSSFWRRKQQEQRLTKWLSTWPVERPKDWTNRIQRAEKPSELEDLRTSVQRGRPFGSADWVRRMAKQLNLENTLRPRGRPKGS